MGPRHRSGPRRAARGSGEASGRRGARHLPRVTADVQALSQRAGAPPVRPRGLRGLRQRRGPRTPRSVRRQAPARLPRHQRRALGDWRMPRNFPYESLPTGWFQVAWSDELEIGEAKPLAYFGTELVLYRGESGAPVV